MLIIVSSVWYSSCFYNPPIFTALRCKNTTAIEMLMAKGIDLKTRDARGIYHFIVELFYITLLNLENQNLLSRSFRRHLIITQING